MEGERVVFKTLNPPSLPYTSVSWRFGDQDIIVLNSTTCAAYTDRVSLDNTTAALEMRRLTLNDAGRYFLTIVTEEGEEHTGNTTLEVYGKSFLSFLSFKWHSGFSLHPSPPHPPLLHFDIVGRFSC